MRVGIDFDNTIVCYDGLFHRVASEAGLIPPGLPVNKSEVRNHLRATGREPVWTEMQGTVYGARMSEATAYPGVLEFLRGCHASGIPVFIISHKTRHPFAGHPHDLHAAARSWLAQNGVFDRRQIGLSESQVFFELTKGEKLARIAACGCTHFIDDLPEILLEPAFPSGVRKILFDPHRLHPETSQMTRLESWDEASVLLGLDLHAGKPPSPGATAATRAEPGTEEFQGLRALVSEGGFALERPPELAPLPGGANNQVFKLVANGQSLVLKRYFHDAADPRDRFGAERAFYTWCWSQGVRSIPRPLAWSSEHRLGLFEYIDGRRLAAAEINAGHIAEAIGFVAGINRCRDQAEARALPAGSEACFSVQTHLERIARRVARLETIPRDCTPDRAAAEFVALELAPAWEVLKERIQEAAGDEAAAELPHPRRCLSPSDFGFHNALVDPDGHLRFFDFEYAGWDDPAKLVGDFFSQPRIPVGLEHWERVVSRLDEALGWSGELMRRARLLLPAYRIKWCCILLNEFVPSDRARRNFAGRDAVAVEAGKAVQLAKAREALSRHKETPGR